MGCKKKELERKLVSLKAKNNDLQREIDKCKVARINQRFTSAGVVSATCLYCNNCGSKMGLKDSHCKYCGSEEQLE